MDIIPPGQSNRKQSNAENALKPVLPPNQSLKLTEIAVDDLTRAKQPATIGRDLPRADWLPSLRRFAAAA